MSLADRFRKFFVTHPYVQPAPAGPQDPGYRKTFFGPFVGPGAPITPIVGEGPPRYFDYVSGVNSNVVPRTEYSSILPDFGQLWMAYLLMPVMRVCVTFRTQQILSLGWKLKARKGSGFRVGRDGDSIGARAIHAIVDEPDPQNGYNFEQWLRSILEEIYVTDACTIFPVRNRLKRVVAFNQIDGQTIKPLIDYERGGIPVPPNPAFLQYIKGTAFRAFTSEDLVYKPFRPRSWCIYGQSRVENIMLTAALYQLHENWTADYFTQGNIPECVYIIDPAVEQQEWTPEKLKEWQEILDKMYGTNVARRRIHVAPPFVKDVKPLKAFSFERNLPDWLVRLLCIEFGVPSYLFTSETNRATAKEMNDTLYEAPLRGDLLMVKRLWDKLIGIANAPELEFDWAKEQDYRKSNVDGLALLTNPSSGSPVMRIPEARMWLGLEEGEGETQNDQPADDGGQADPGRAGGDQPPDAAPDGGGGAGGQGAGAADDRPHARAAQPPASRSSAVAPAKEEAASEPLHVYTDRPAAAVPGATPDKEDPDAYHVHAAARTTPAVGGRRGRRFIGRGAGDKARLATGLANTVLKRLRQQQAQIQREALERAKARAKKVKGVV